MVGDFPGGCVSGTGSMWVLVPRLARAGRIPATPPKKERQPLTTTNPRKETHPSGAIPGESHKMANDELYALNLANIGARGRFFFSFQSVSSGFPAVVFALAPGLSVARQTPIRGRRRRKRK